MCAVFILAVAVSADDAPKSEDVEAVIINDVPKPDKEALAKMFHKSDKEAVIKSSSRSADLNGNYQYQYESSNGISSGEGGVGGQIVQGSTTWIAKNGEPLSISYVADENGYRPKGFHLPTSPPIPLAIQRALEYLKTKKPDTIDYD